MVVFVNSEWRGCDTERRRGIVRVKRLFVWCRTITEEAGEWRTNNHKVFWLRKVARGGEPMNRHAPAQYLANKSPSG